MIGSTQHIVSAVKWDLVFNEKKEVNSLQNKLSAWSKTQLLIEMESIFNELCPPDQTWKIQSIELDLGIIPYHSMMTDLPQKFRTLLLNKLKDSIYRGYLEGEPVEIVENSDSKLQIFKNYLEQGYMPWNQFGIISINELFTEQLTQNKEMLMALIRQVGQAEYIRKRMAWQFSESSIIALIRELEPNNHQEVEDFISNFTVIQAKKQIIQSTSSEFQKNLWFWVLNHLFEERGTLFNRVSFMESSIRQMARKMNVSFEFLFHEIEAVVTDISHKIVIKGQFILALGLIGKTIRKTDSVLQQSENTDFYVHELRQLFLTADQLATKTEITKLNELVIQLAVRDTIGLKKVIQQIGTNRKAWYAIFKKLNEAAKLSILKVLARNKSIFVQQTIQFFAGIDVRKSTTSLLKWETESVLFMLDTSVGVFSEEKYINQLITSVSSEYKSQFVNRLKHQLISANDAKAYTKNMAVETFQLIRENVLNDTFLENETSHIAELATALKQLFKVLKANPEKISTNSQFEEAQATLNYFIRHKPQQVIDGLKSYVAHPKREAFVSQYLETDQLEQLFYYSTAPIAVSILRIYRQLLIHSEKELRFKPNTSSEFLTLSFLLWIENESIQPEVLVRKLEQMLQKLVINRGEVVLKIWLETQLNLIYSTEYSLVKLGDSVDDKADISRGISENNEFELKSEIEDAKKITFQKIKQILKSNPLNWMKQTAIRVKYETMNACFPSMDKEFTRFLSNFTSTDSIIDSDLKRDGEFIFWKCLAAWDEHHGDLRQFMQLIAKNRKSYFHRVSVQPILFDKSKPAFKINKLGTNSGEKILQINDLKVDDPSFSRYFEQLLAANNQAVIQWLIKTIKTDPDLSVKISKKIDFEYFIHHVFAEASTKNRAIKVCFQLFKALEKLSGSANFRATLLVHYWNDVFELIMTNVDHQAIFMNRIRLIFRGLALEKELSASELMLFLRNHPLNLPPFIRNYFIAMNPSFALELTLNDHKINPSAIHFLEAEIKAERFTALVKCLIFDDKVPLWLTYKQELTVGKWLEIMLKEFSNEFRNALITFAISDAVLFKLKKQLKFSTWIEALKISSPKQISVLTDLNLIHQLFEQVKFTGITYEKVQNSIFKKLINAWKNNRWTAIEPKQFWQEISWELHLKYTLDKSVFLTDIQQVKMEIPVAYKLRLRELVETEKTLKTNQSRIQFSTTNEREKKGSIPYIMKTTKINESITVTNAGIVLINSYIKLLFDRLGLLENNKFKTVEDQLKSVHYLQYVVNGLTENEEHFLVLNKVICALALEEPVHEKINMSVEEKSLIDGMITAIINYWPAIGNSSINGFRGNWLIRKGLLTELDDNWTLTVEKKPYDVLINQSPFSFSIIKHQWMEKPIHVEWAY